MFKRANKITSLLVAAAAVVSLVPASAADVKKIDSEDGTIYNAVAYADGKAYVDGEINDDEAAYYVANGTQTVLEDVDSGDELSLFGEKYLDIEDGDYTVNLEDGSVNDDDIAGDTADDAGAALRKKIKDDTDDRYDEDTSGVIKKENELKIVPGNFTATWYYTTYDNADTTATRTNAGRDLNVFTDVDGNYIDADYNVGKIKVKTTDDSVTIENTDDTYDLDDKNDAISASVQQLRVLAQDKDNIYRLVQVTIDSPDSDVLEVNGKAIDATGAIFEGTANSVQYYAIQKISKAQASDEVDGAKYAKAVTTYALSKDDATALDAEDLFIDNTGTVVDETKYTVAGGKLIAYTTDETVTGASSAGAKVLVRAYTLKAKSGFYYADEESDSKEDVEVSDDQGSAVETDVDGNLYRLDGGYIYKFDNTDDWDKLYKVDGSFDEFSVYDENNIVAWSEDDEVYSLIGAEKAAEEPATETPVVTAGWVQAADGTWAYNKADGTKATGWLNLNGTWYYLKADGVMATGWVQDGATWYYLQASGAMATGWLNDNGTWYYLNASGAMLANTTVDGYVLGASGAWVK